MKNELVITFPHIGNYYIPISKLIENTLDGRVLVPPPITKKTIELGVRHSPDFVCIPFKYNLGNYIEALDMGANTLIHAGGGCRFGYYGEVLEQILKDLGYQFNFFSLVDTHNMNILFLYKKFSSLNPSLKLFQFIKAFRLAKEQIDALDNIDIIIRKNIGFEKVKGSFENLSKEFHAKLKDTQTINEVRKLEESFLERFKNLPLNKPAAPLKIGIVGELYTLMEPFSSYFIEKEVAKKGIEVTRYITVSYLIFAKEHKEKIIVKEAAPYLKFAIGADGTDSVSRSQEFAKGNFDGIIHIKPFGCTPEVNSIPVIQNISRDYNIPVIYFSFDSQTSETGIKTRLEAFYDMLSMRKENAL
ncbi:2-hydroxyglutaryl-CoA dehydratase, D-component [Oxobacter pfennigii]|uniref:2-hydroxyglutaryl-CoA dehydratase, D-component n=1 Tax=Oxobacter pfennigii TaxID=36849 RepID=A0A0P8W4R6_9CLOT|nr:2-hydroxyacyl-CoA dehydratase [Oxobacter pfennigii]KPU43577.1 2-hydroxyglutaryl-CoA dehydratase, D-component [Oxobacter pfennigii]